MRGLFRVTAWERVSWWRRALGAFARVAALLVVLDVLFGLLGPPIGFFFMARWEARKMPALSVTPEPLRDYSVSKSPGTTFSCFGYQFEAPWGGSFTTQGLPKNNDTTGMILIKFGSGQNVLFIVPSDQNGLLAELAEDPKYQSSRAVFGSLIDASAYDQYSALLNTTPSTIRAFGPRAEAVRGMVLLTIKAIAPLETLNPARSCSNCRTSADFRSATRRSLVEVWLWRFWTCEAVGSRSSAETQEMARKSLSRS